MKLFSRHYLCLVIISIMMIGSLASMHRTSAHHNLHKQNKYELCSSLEKILRSHNKCDLQNFIDTLGLEKAMVTLQSLESLTNFKYNYTKMWVELLPIEYDNNDVPPESVDYPDM
jgi:hypothetical protein